MTRHSAILALLLTACGEPAGDCDPSKFDQDSCPVGAVATCEYSRDVHLEVGSDITVERGAAYDVVSDVVYVLAEDHAYYCEAIQPCDEDAGYQPHMTESCFGCAIVTDDGLDSPCDR